MRYQPAVDPVTGDLYQPVAVRGVELLSDALLNKGTAFTVDEREMFGLTGLLPARVSTIEEQVDRSRHQLEAKATDLERHIYLAALHDRNETLFHRLIVDDQEGIVPLIYTPTVAEACRHWSRIHRVARGIYITRHDRGRVHSILANHGHPEARVVVMTDNERILGIGDQGAGGMGIPIGKLALYSAGAGIHPSLCVPISLDIGTDNEELLADPLYLGVREPRLRGDRYRTLVAEVVDAIKVAYPRALLQWEDFANRTSFDHVDTYRTVLPSFNDDIQGTAAMVLGGLLAATRRIGQSLDRQRFVIAGAGSAGIGIARQLIGYLTSVGANEADARRQVVVTDSRGLVHRNRTDLTPPKRTVAVDTDIVTGFGDDRSLEAIVNGVKPTVLIGVTGTPGAITEGMVRAMSSFTAHPIVLPLSNPTSFTEAVPGDVIAWSGGTALVATGSPFADVVHNGRRHRIGQANNAFVFPGVGLGTIVARAREVTDGMFIAAAGALADMVDDDDLQLGSLFPPMHRMREVSMSVARAVARAAIAEGVGEEIELDRALAAMPWFPTYLPYRPA